MVMANGTAAQKIQFRPRKTSTEIRPDAPEGEWEALIPKGTCKVLVTQAGDPRLVIPHKLEKAEDEKNESFQGSIVNLSVIIFDDEDPEKLRGANMMKTRLRALCEAAEVEFADVYPAEVKVPEDFDPLFRAIEGKRFTVWTVHSKRSSQSGEEIIDTEIRYKKPGSGLVTRSADSEEEERPGVRKAGAAKGNKRK